MDLAAIFKQTPSFPLYGGMKWKTRSLSLKCFFRFGGDFLKKTLSFLLYEGINTSFLYNSAHAVHLITCMQYK